MLRPGGLGSINGTKKGMGSNRRSFRYLILLTVFALVAAACGGDDDDGAPEEGEAQSGGTLTFGAEQFPANLNCFHALNNIAWCYYMNESGVRLGAYEQMPDLTYRPVLLDGEAEVDEGPPFIITYRIKDEAVWSDGTPVSARDFEFTWQTIMDPKNEPVGRSGYDKIESAEIIDDKTITFTFSEPVAAWKDLFGMGLGNVYPAHILEGQDWDTAWNKCICDPETGDPIGNGPFLLTEFKKNQRIVWERNPNWWGPHEPYLDSVVWKYVLETTTQIEQVRGGEVDVIFPQWQLELEGLTDAPGLTYDAAAGTLWQHLDFQFGTAPLDEVWLRQAIAYAIDREAIVERLVRPGQDDAEVLQNLIYVANHADYEPHFDTYTYDPDQAVQLLEDNGCTKGGDGFYECDGNKLSFTYKSTAGNALRELMFQIIQANLKAVGIEVTNAFGEADVVFTDLTKKDYEVFQFGWVGSPDPSGAVLIYKCEGDQNYQDYCNEEVTELLEETDRTLDPVERADIFNQADALMAEDMVSLPLWQAPQPIVAQDYVHGLVLNASQQGPLWNAADVWIEQ